MAPPELDTSVGYSFGLEFDDVAITAITEVSGLKMERDVVELKENGPDGEHVVRRLPGRWKSGEITLTRGLTQDTTFEKWVKDSHFGEASDSRKSGAITLLDVEGNVIKRYTLTNAWPRSLEIGSLTAGDTSVVTERLVLVYERLELE